MLKAIAKSVLALLVAGGVLLASAWAADDKHADAGHKHGKKGAAHAGHNHDAHHLSEEDVELPKDFASAVARVKACRKTIGAEIAAGRFDEVHRPLDEATIILRKLMPIARDSGVPKNRWQEVNAASKDLQKRLGDLHGALDKKSKVDFKTASQPIDQAIKRLETVAKAPSATSIR